MQVQGQLEVCDLDECDFLQVKLDEYIDENEYKSDILDLSKPLTHEYPNVPGYDNTINGKTNFISNVTTISENRSFLLPNNICLNLSLFSNLLYSSRISFVPISLLG